MGDTDSPGSDHVDPATSATTTPTGVGGSLWQIEEASADAATIEAASYGSARSLESDGSLHCYVDEPQEYENAEGPRQFDRCIARIVELAMDADLTLRETDEEVGHADGNVRGDEEETDVLVKKLDRAYEMMSSLRDRTQEGESGQLYLPGVFKVMMRSCLSHGQVDRAFEIYNRSVSCGVVVNEIEFQRLCSALEKRDGAVTLHDSNVEE
jgi:pentatricopeptide repeat protein